MQNKARYHRIQLLPYDLIDTQFWNLPLNRPTPLFYVITRENIVPFPYKFGRLPRKIHLLALKQSSCEAPPAQTSI